MEDPRNIRGKVADAAFVSFIPKLWYTPPTDTREASSLNIFDRKLKTYLLR